MVSDGDSGISVLDSGRKDIVYEDWYGSKLDRKMLEVLKRN
jgi:endoglucanase